MGRVAGSYLWWLLAVFAITGFLESLIPDRGGAYGSLAFPQWLLMAMLLFGWCKAHARSRGIAEPPGAATICGLFPLVGVPLYFYRGFGFRTGSLGVLKAALFFVLLQLAYAAASFPVEYLNA